jgi:hypothetical protein
MGEGEGEGNITAGERKLMNHFVVSNKNCTYEDRNSHNH